MCKDLPALLYNYRPSDSLCLITLPDYDEDTKAFDTYKMMNKTRDSIHALENGYSDLTNNTRDLLHKTGVFYPLHHHKTRHSNIQLEGSDMFHIHYLTLKIQLIETKETKDLSQH